MNPHDQALVSSRATTPFAGRNAACVVVGLALFLSACGSQRSAPSSDAGSLDAQLTDLQTKTQLHPDQAYWPHAQAEVLLELDRSAEARAQLESALALDPTYAPTLARLGQLWFDAQEHEVAIQHLEAARQKMGEAFPAELAVGLALHYQAMQDENAPAMFQNLSNQPQARTYHLLSGDDFLEARPWAEAALDQSETAANYNNLGITSLYEGKPDEARRHFEKALELDPNLPGPMYNLAIVENFYFFDPDRSRTWLSQYLKLAQDDPDGLQEILADVEAAR